jgi:MFS transporter, BCD family, chlorophyll transporter
MALGDLPAQENSLTAPPLPKLNQLTMFRLGLFQMGLGMMSLLTLGVLNRVMIQELAIPATIVVLTLSMNQFVAPVRVWFGQMSDARPIRGFHRTGYVWLGAVGFAIASFLAVQVVWKLGESFSTQGWSGPTYLWTGLLGLVFALYGLAISASSTPFTALLVDVSDEENRAQLVSIVWSMLMVGIILGAIITSSLLKQIQADTPLEILQASINRIFMVIPVGVVGLTIFATLGVEKTYSRYGSRSSIGDREDSITLIRALKVLTASRQTGIFFLFLLMMTLSLFLQEPVLEPYGGEVFGMTISETTRLNAFWGTGTLFGLGTTGFWIVPRLGKFNTTRLGCILVAGCFMLLIAAGFTANPRLLIGAIFMFGWAAGITTTGALNLMLDLTAAETAGTFVGAWGLSQAIARGAAVVIGGSALDLGRTLFGTPLLAYGLVFCLPILGMSLALGLLNQVNIEEFQLKAKTAIADILSEEIN